MRLFLLPVSTRRTLIFCERAPIQQLAAGAKPPLSERVISRATQTWMTWEKAEKGWQKQLTYYGNQLFRKIPFEEWGLKSIPPATKQRLQDVDDGKIKFECLYPGKFIGGKSSEVGEQRILDILRKLATERQSLHQKRLWTCVAWMPITVPFTLVPVIPNIPFFYLVFRAYSHYRALYGSRLLEHLVKKNLITSGPSSKLDEMYALGLLHTSHDATKKAVVPDAQTIDTLAEAARAKTNNDEKEVILLQQWNGKLLAEAFELPEMEIEIERAVEQVEKALAQPKEQESESNQDTHEIRSAATQTLDEESKKKI